MDTLCGPDCGCPPRLESNEPTRRSLPVHDGRASCTLDEQQARQRESDWRRLAADSLTSRERAEDGSVVLRFDGDTGTEARVRELADLEQRCCAFFDMTITRDGDEVVLHAAAPDTHRDYLDLLLDATR